MKNILTVSLLSLKEMGDNNTPITFDELVKGVIGADDILLDSIDKEATEEIENNLLLLLDEIGVPEMVINDFLSSDDRVSSSAGLSIAKSIANQYDEMNIISNVEDYLDSKDKIEFDSVLPERKAGYTRKLVVRNGKKVWINKRNPNIKVHLSTKQKIALMKARLKAHTSLANHKREISLKKRANFNLK